MAVRTDDERRAGRGLPARARAWAAAHRRAVAAAGAVLMLALGAGAVTSWRWFVHPTVDGPVRADAIVMFGGAGERFERAVELADAGYADVVLIADPTVPGERFTAYGWFCRNDGGRPGYPVHDYEAICYDPEPATTRGEARYVARLAEERGWERIDLVTTVDQATRARMLLARCWDGEIASVVVDSDAPRPLRIAYEWGAMARATLQRRGC